MDHRSPQRSVRSGHLADHLRLQHPGRVGARRPRRSARSLPRRPRQLLKCLVPLLPNAVRRLRTASRPWLVPLVDTGGTQFFTAPDDACGLEHSYAPSSPPESPDPVWKAWGGHWENPHWTAQFTRLTPTDVVTAFTTSLLSAEPVERTVKDIPHRSRYAVKIAAATTPAPNRLPAPVATPLPRPATNRTR
ncbi:DUF317 domain-containing protein [Streptomyces eurythermus]